jgi:hypothetical protein
MVQCAAHDCPPTAGLISRTFPQIAKPLAKQIPKHRHSPNPFTPKALQNSRCAGKGNALVKPSACPVGLRPFRSPKTLPCSSGFVQALASDTNQLLPRSLRNSVLPRRLSRCFGAFNFGISPPEPCSTTVIPTQCPP